MGGKTAEATATKTKTAIGLLTALQAARQTRLDGGGPRNAELDPGRGERQAAADQLEC